MSLSITSIREILPADFSSIIDYFLKADHAFLSQLGVDINKLPTREGWLNRLKEEDEKPLHAKTFYYIIWLLNGEPVGHCNINKIRFGEDAYMHLHMWKRDKRQCGLGYGFVKECIPVFFGKFKLQKLYCEPNAFNEAPNKTLAKLGFTFLEQYDTVPGWINSHQTVKRWMLEK